MVRPRGTLGVHYGERDLEGWNILERNRAGKYLWWYEIALSQSSMRVSNQFITHLDHDHREGENICFFTIRPLPVQDLWRSPLCSMTLSSHGAWHGIRVLSDRGKTKIGNLCVAGIIHKDIGLDTSQYGGKKGPVSIAYSFEISMNYVAGVKEMETLSNVR